MGLPGERCSRICFLCVSMVEQQYPHKGRETIVFMQSILCLTVELVVYGALNPGILLSMGVTNTPEVTHHFPSTTFLMWLRGAPILGGILSRKSAG